MRFDACRKVLAAAVAGVLWGLGCDDPVRTPPADPKPPPGEVWGRAMDVEGIPSRYVPPIHIGGQSTEVGPDGTFRFAGVQAPYDLVVGDTGDSMATGYGHQTVVYEGVGRSDPVLLYPSYSSSSYGGSAYITGRVPYVPFWNTRVIVVGPDGHADSRWVDSISSAYTVQARWSHGETARVTLYFLRYDGEVLRDALVRSLSVRDDERRVVDLENAVFPPAQTIFLNGSFRVEPYNTDRSVEIFVNFGRDLVQLTNFRPSTRFPDAFSATLPLFPRATYEVEVSTSWYTDGTRRRGKARAVGFRNGDDPMRFTLYDAPQLLEPADDATGVDLATPLRWSSSAGAGTYHLQIQGSTSDWYWSVRLYTSRTEVRLSEVPALQGFMRPGTRYSWSVRQLPTAATVDDVLAGRDCESEGYSESDNARFTTLAAPGAVP